MAKLTLTATLKMINLSADNIQVNFPSQTRTIILRNFQVKKNFHLKITSVTDSMNFQEYFPGITIVI